jgi:hypothetical protein
LFFYGTILLGRQPGKTKEYKMGNVLLLNAKFTLMRLAAETTIDAYLLQEDDELMELINNGTDYEKLFEYCNENY